MFLDGLAREAQIERPDCARPISVTELFTIGIGPSSSHTVGPMRAALDFAERAIGDGPVVRVRCELFGSLSLTGRGHATDRAVLLGLAGFSPEGIDPDRIDAIILSIRGSLCLSLAGRLDIPFDAERDLIFAATFLPQHPNGMRFTAVYDDGRRYEESYFSVGGGAILRGTAQAAQTNVALAYPFTSGAELLAIGDATGLSIGRIVEENERAWRPEEETNAFLDAVRTAMLNCVARGCVNQGILPGGLNVPRRAKRLLDDLAARGPRADPSLVFEWVSLWALAVNEENAAGGRVVTAPTNGAAGVLPAIVKYYEEFTAAPTRAGSRPDPNDRGGDRLPLQETSIDLGRGDGVPG